MIESVSLSAYFLIVSTLFIIVEQNSTLFFGFLCEVFNVIFIWDFKSWFLSFSPLVSYASDILLPSISSLLSIDDICCFVFWFNNFYLLLNLLMDFFFYLKLG